MAKYSDLESPELPSTVRRYSGERRGPVHATTCGTLAMPSACVSYCYTARGKRQKVTLRLSGHCGSAVLGPMKHEAKGQQGVVVLRDDDARPPCVAEIASSTHTTGRVSLEQSVPTVVPQESSTMAAQIRMLSNVHRSRG